MKYDHTPLTQSLVEEFCANLPEFLSDAPVHFPDINLTNLLDGDPFHPLYDFAREQESKAPNVLGLVDTEALGKLPHWTKAEAALWAIGLCIPSRKICRQEEGPFKLDAPDKMRLMEYLDTFFRGAPTEDTPTNWINYSVACGGKTLAVQDFSLDTQSIGTEPKAPQSKNSLSDALATESGTLAVQNEECLSAPTGNGQTKLPRGLTTSNLVHAMCGYMGVENPSNVLSGYPKWALKNKACIQRGKAGKPGSSEWNPVQFALNLLDKPGTPMISGKGKLTADMLDTVFGQSDLEPWREIWKEKSRPRRR